MTKNAATIIAAAAIAILLGCLCGCRAAMPAEAPATVSARDTVWRTAVKTDSVYVRDSVRVEGEKVYKERTVYRDRRFTDTVYIARTDTVRIQAPAPESRKLTAWEQTKQDWFGRLCAVAAALLLWTFRKPIVRIIRRYV